MDEKVAALIGLVIVGIVEALKQAGMPARFAPIVSIVVGGVLGAGVAITQGQAGGSLLLFAVEGLALGGAATGVYAVAGEVGGKRGPTVIEHDLRQTN